MKVPAFLIHFSNGKLMQNFGILLYEISFCLSIIDNFSPIEFFTAAAGYSKGIEFIKVRRVIDCFFEGSRFNEFIVDGINFLVL